MIDFQFDDGAAAYALASTESIDVVSLTGDGLDGGQVDLPTDVGGGAADLVLDFTNLDDIDFVRTPNGDYWGTWVRVLPEAGTTSTLLCALPLMTALASRRLERRGE